MNSGRYFVVNLSKTKETLIFDNVPHFAMFGAGTILARSATPAPNMGGATVRSEAAVRVV